MQHTAHCAHDLNVCVLVLGLSWAESYFFPSHSHLFEFAMRFVDKIFAVLARIWLFLTFQSSTRKRASCPGASLSRGASTKAGLICQRSASTSPSAHGQSGETCGKE